MKHNTKNKDYFVAIFCQPKTPNYLISLKGAVNSPLVNNRFFGTYLIFKLDVDIPMSKKYTKC